MIIFMLLFKSFKKVVSNILLVKVQTIILQLRFDDVTFAQVRFLVNFAKYLNVFSTKLSFDIGFSKQ
jgi:hypothetical protein